MAFTKPLVDNERTFTTNRGKANVFMKAYAAVNRLNFSRTERSHIRQLKEVLSSPTVDEDCCQPFQPSELDRVIWRIRSKGAPVRTTKCFIP